MEQFYSDFKQEAEGKTREELSKLKVKLSRKYHLPKAPTDVDIYLKTGIRLQTKPMRTQSGVAPLALMTAPFACPHGKCVYCPGGPGSAFGNVPQSYTGKEPSTMRGIRNNYDPYLIVFNRLQQLVATGHHPDKTEVIVQGGTFPALPEKYQEDFITYALKAMNDFGDLFYTPELNLNKFCKFFEMPGEKGNDTRQKKIQEKELAIKGATTLEKEQQRNETTKIRCVALCIETKPDWCFEKHIDDMLRLGTTRVEMGVQALREEVMQKTHRGHTLQDAVKATKLMRNSLLKIGYHMMPGLPGMTKEMDLEDYKELFENENYKPDAIKIYPTVVMKGTGLYGMWKAGKYVPLTTDDAAEIIVEAKKHMPKWCRIMRVQRDIPSTVIDAGPNMTNMRQLVEKKLKEKGMKCRCIRCREPRNKQISWEQVKLLREDYDAHGKEIFLSFEDTKNDLLLGFCRLRIIPESHRKEVLPNSAAIRELHVYGQAIALGEEGNVQHKGMGKKLMAEAERIAREEFGCKKILVISGIGVREYYYKLGYKKDGVYVSKEL
ncbi:tRNA uridine(34) 5-carboxymethylaminomethyl modification radical SAM/GNAT enzyme Elp3 [Candidatus Woesearchaeota archaeon CG10_big_fil_rev_8_21_14_0_10_37_12]|nr:MAG: tRNA uridine(34) 5-carboxymethylaminomethyl modification radical SAM/GNAT enzyme Elp3 [Candidatus Woesearchaeota archaeon CG10_big_fil_rev_8_21_14_0_10_37_12]